MTGSIIRLPGIADGLIASSTPLTPGPLRVLFLAAEPLDYEEEEQSIQKVSEGLDMNLAICESGTWEELKERAKSFRPHLVHLAGQAKVSGGIAVFSMQGPAGRADLRTAEELAAALKDSGLVGIILSGRQSETTFSYSSALPEAGREYSSGCGLECTDICQQALIPVPGRRSING